MHENWASNINNASHIGFKFSLEMFLRRNPNRLFPYVLETRQILRGFMDFQGT